MSATIGVFGGTGFYSILESVEERWIDTPYGPPSDKIAIGKYKDKGVAFLPRHGKTHHLPPHKINYQANVWAMKSLGVKYVISPAAAGSLQKHIKPGDFVVPDQFVDRTVGRRDTFYDGPIVTHMPSVEPFCPILRKRAVESLEENRLPHHKTGTTVVIQGPRFSSKAESQWFTREGWDIVNMTQYPEGILTREMEMCYCSVALITDYDSGLDGTFASVTAEEAMATFVANTDKLKKAVLDMIEAIEKDHACSCHHALKEARF